MYEALIDQIREALGQRGRAMDVRSIPSLVAPLHPSDLAAILDELTLPFLDARKRVAHYPEIDHSVRLVAMPTTAGTGSEVSS